MPSICRGRGAARAEPGRGNPAPAEPAAQGDRPEAGAGTATRSLVRRRAGADRVPDLRPDRRPPGGVAGAPLARRRPDRERAPRRRVEDRDGRAIALTPGLHEELWQHRRRSAFKGDDERVFCHPDRGTIYRYETYKDELERAFKRAGLEWPEGLKSCHDLRTTAITNDAIAGAHPIAIMTKAGHASMATTKRYLKLAGVVFRDEAQALEERLLGASLSTGSHTDLSTPDPTSDDAASRRTAETTASDLP